NPTCPDGLWALVLKLLEKDPDRRFQSSEELDEALRPFVPAKEEHPLAKTLARERKDRALDAVCEQHGRRPPPASRPVAAVAAKEEPKATAPSPDGTVRLPAGFVAPSPCADVTRPVVAVPVMKAPFPMARPRTGVIDVGTLRVHVARTV